MALARVQATPQGLTGSASAVAVTFTAPPTVGSAIAVVIVSRAISTPATSCTDTRGNAYTLAAAFPGGGGNLGVAVWLAVVATTGAPFTITAAGAASANRLAVALEVSGAGSGLLVDQSQGTDSLGVSGAAGPTPPLTADTVLLLAALTASSAGGTFLTVNTATPPWTQEAEQPNTPVAGEIDSRLLASGALGTTPSVSWAWDMGAAGFVGAIVALKAGAAAAAPERVQPYVWMPV